MEMRKKRICQQQCWDGAQRASEISRFKPFLSSSFSNPLLVFELFSSFYRSNAKISSACYTHPEKLWRFLRWKCDSRPASSCSQSVCAVVVCDCLSCRLAHSHFERFVFELFESLHVREAFKPAERQNENDKNRWQSSGWREGNPSAQNFSFERGDHKLKLLESGM